jgi:hypothetical protein
VQFALALIVALGAGMPSAAMLDAFQTRTTDSAPEVLEAALSPKVPGPKRRHDGSEARTRAHLAARPGAEAFLRAAGS